jgi:hypothetical protein
MTDINQAAADFLDNKRIAVTGVSREPEGHGVDHVWMHRGPGPGSVWPSAAVVGHEHGITVIDGGCPLMFDPIADFAHKCTKAVLTLTRTVPKQV